ncbi:MAG: membrane protein insertase YidC [Elusimicrobiota bacterium]
MDKNLFLAVALSILVYVGWFAYLNKKYPQAGQRPPAEAVKPQAQPSAVHEPQPSSGAENALPPRAEPPGSRPPRLETYKFKYDGLTYEIQPMGASIVSYKYPAPLGPVELVHEPVPGFFATWPELRFRQAEASKPVFEAELSGVRIRKEFLFAEPGGMHSLRITLANPGSGPAELKKWGLDLGPGMGTVKSEQKENATLWAAAALLPPPAGRKAPVFENFKVSGAAASVEKPWRWLGVHNRYFLAAVFPPEADFSRAEHGASLWKKERGFFGRESQIMSPWMRVEGAARTLAPGETAVIDIPFFFGPKGYTRLSSFNQGLERSVSFGWFHPVGRFTLGVLEFFFSKTGNWGWSIILLTVVLQFILFPLTYKQMKSMAVMKRIQPEIQKVQQKFAKDQRRMQMEMMELYKKHGANPLGGCLPMLVQLPVFVALFNMLRNAWELHGAPWMFWVKDLSAHDPFYVLPIVMGGIMFFQNKLNPPAATDPAQAKVFTYMPLIFTFMFLNFPSGLVLYWLTNSILSVAQQLALKDRLQGEIS